MDWFRFYHGVINDPKVQIMPIECRWRWVEMLCLCSMNDPRGTLPPLNEVAFQLRICESEASSIIDQLVKANLIDKSPGSRKLRIHGWENRQRASDDEASKKRRQRSRDKSRKCPGTDSGPRVRATDTDTDTEERRGELPPTPPGGDVGGVVLDPEVERTGNIVSEMAGDVSWEMWVHNQHRMGCSIKDIQTAIEVCVNKNSWSMPLADGVLKRIARDRANSNNRGEH